MNKKQRNRKLVKQNKRNRIVNRRYSSTIKSLLKLFKLKRQIFENVSDSLEKETQEKEIKMIVRKLYSILDKAVKKDVIHKNNAARKKSKISLICNKL